MFLNPQASKTMTSRFRFWWKRKYFLYTVAHYFQRAALIVKSSQLWVICLLACLLKTCKNVNSFMEIKALELHLLQGYPEITQFMTARRSRTRIFVWINSDLKGKRTCLIFFLTIFPEIFHGINYNQKCFSPLLAGIWGNFL